MCTYSWLPLQSEANKHDVLHLFEDVAGLVSVVVWSSGNATGS